MKLKWIGIYACTAILAQTSFCVSAENIKTLDTPESIYLQKSGRQLMYPGENFPVIEVDSVDELGKLTALSFIDWVAKNPQGVVALPTGKTPELFIKFINYYKKKWHDPQVQEELNLHGIALSAFPETSGLKFVQLDEFYPISPEHQNSFIQYVRKYYLDILDIHPDNALLIDISEKGVLKQHGIQAVFPDGHADLTLLERAPVTAQEKIQKAALLEAQQFCQLYEEKIKSLGGIGFFLGGIGYDGHIAFNQPGSQRESQTRLVQLSYPSAAQSAVDLGGIQYARNKAAISIGLETITRNPEAKVLITAAGEGKAPILRKTIESSVSEELPISLLRDHKHLQFYLTQGAASELTARVAESISRVQGRFELNNLVQNTLIQICMQESKALSDITIADLNKSMLGKAILEHAQFDLAKIVEATRGSITHKIEGSSQVGFGQTILHTAPHHDDVMLSYYGYMPELLKNSQNYFSYVTSGFNSVTDRYIMDNLYKLQAQPVAALQTSVFQRSYADAVADFSKQTYPEQKKYLDDIDAVILGKKLSETYSRVPHALAMLHKSKELTEEYFQAKNPGQMDSEPMKILKGAMRESEVDRLWAMNDVPLNHIFHMRSKFYTGEDFNPLPTIKDDAQPIVNLLSKTKPNIVTVALDPEGTGPDTHYKVLQVVAQALKMWPADDVHVWGYRNVWYRFKPTDANRYIPISEAQLSKIDTDFTQCFYTQKEAAFPSPKFDGKFSQLSVQIQKEQLQTLRLLLGNAYFDKHTDQRVRDAAGFLFFRDMNRAEFLAEALSLKSRVQLDEAFEKHKTKRQA